jgi:hypothetical protein
MLMKRLEGFFEYEEVAERIQLIDKGDHPMIIEDKPLPHQLAKWVTSLLASVIFLSFVFITKIRTKLHMK